MNITSLSLGLSQMSVDNQVAVKVMDMSLDNYEKLGSEMTKMMELSVNPSVGQNIDLSV